MTRDLCIILFMRSLLKLSHELYLHLHMCSLVSLLNMRSLLYLLYVCFLLKCDYLFCNYPLSLFVILRLELHVYIMLTFMFCEINDIYIYSSIWWCHNVSISWWCHNMEPHLILRSCVRRNHCWVLFPCLLMMTSSHGNALRITLPSRRATTGLRRISPTAD